MNGPATPRTQRVWASLEKTPEELITEMFDEAEHRDPDHQKTWIAPVDGNATQIRIGLSARDRPSRRMEVALLDALRYVDGEEHP